MSVHTFAWAGVLLVLGIVVAAVWGLVALWRAVRGRRDDSVSDAAAATPVPPSDSEERRIILDMVRSGKITESEGAALLDAVGRKTAGQARPVRPASNVGLIVGTLLCVIGFVLPWGYIHMMGVHGYQAGYQVGVIGWVILILALVPVVPACFPGLAASVNMGLLRVIVAGIGGALSGGMLVTMLSRNGDPGAGLFAVVAGFVVLFVSGVRALRRRQA